ncbi:MAG: trigger factor [Chloroflexi bacterium]|nr:trigger factor [Chloroflexota bacterium]MDA1239789.1 trigger factor [Chloroflexota bacterium]
MRVTGTIRRDCRRRYSSLGTTVERLENARVSLEIEVDAERVEKHTARAIQRIAKQVRIPGFRPGKAPRNMVERHVGPSVILQEALEELIPEVYNEAIADLEIEAIDQPEFDLKSTEPLIVTATVPVRPEVDLGDYEALRVPKPDVEINDERVEETLLALRRQYAVLEPVEREVQWNDHIRADVSVTVEEQDPYEEEDAEFPIREGSVVSLPGFVDRLVGLGVGEHTIEFTLPDDLPAETLRGKQVTYVVKIHEVKQEVLPDLDDEFVASLDEADVTTVAELDARLRKDLLEQAERNVREQYHNEIIDLLIAQANLDYPDVLVNREVDRVIDRESNHASHSREGLENWLRSLGRTEEEVRDAFRPEADLVVRRALALGELIDRESIEITDEQIETEIDSLLTQMTGGNPANQQAIRGLIDTPDGRNSIRSQLLTRFAVERLEEICAQAEDAGAAEPRRTSRRRRGSGADDAAETTEATDETAEAPAAEATEEPGQA